MWRRKPTRCSRACPEPFRMDAQTVASYLAGNGRRVAPDAELYESLTTAVAAAGDGGSIRRPRRANRPASVTDCCRSTFGLNAPPIAGDRLLHSRTGWRWGLSQAHLSSCG